jgi:hypothetical protein
MPLREHNMETSSRPRGVGFLAILWGAIIVVLLLYIVAHVHFFANERMPLSASEIITLDAYGRVESILDDDLRWYIGKDQATALEAVMKNTSNRINQAIEGEVKQAMLEFEFKYGRSFYDPDLGRSPSCGVTFDDIRKSFDAGDCAAAAKSLRIYIRCWTTDTKQQAGEASLLNLMYDMEQLADMKQSQVDAVNSITVPFKQRIFWVRPRGALAEGIVWSYFGTLTNLIVNLSHYIARRRYESDQKWISYSKLIYGPILSSVLVLWIYFGVIDAGMEVRFWLIPLLGFLFGYNTKKTAHLIDTLSDKIFATLGVSIKNLGSSVSPVDATSAAQNVAASARPTSIAQAIAMAPKVVSAHVTAALISTRN